MANTEEVREEIEQTKAHMEETVVELKEVVSDRVARAKESVDPRHYARQYPWPALGIALGIGLAIGLSGSDTKAAAAIAEGAKGLGGKIGDGATAAKDAVAERLHRDGGDEPADVPVANETSTGSGGIRAKLATAVDDLLHEGLQEILTGLGPRTPRA
jgi:hypothetical protein